MRLGRLLQVLALAGCVTVANCQTKIGFQLSENERIYTELPLFEGCSDNEDSLTLAKFDGNLNGGDYYTIVATTIFTADGPSRELARNLESIIENNQGKNVVFLTSLKGGGSCEAWLQYTGSERQPNHFYVDDFDRRLHYRLFDIYSELVVMDSDFNIRYQFGPEQIEKLQGYIDDLEVERASKTPQYNPVLPLDCVVSEFTPWSACLSSCLGKTDAEKRQGSRRRTRKVLLPAQGSGRACPELMVETESCSTNMCFPDQTLSKPRPNSSSCVGEFGEDPEVVIIHDGEAVDGPMQIHFHPLYADQLWITNNNTDSFTVLEIKPNREVRRFVKLRDRHPYHYMDNVSSFSFSPTGELATCQDSLNNYDFRMKPNFFQGPTLYDTDRSMLVSHMDESLRCGQDGLYGSGDPNVECYMTHTDMLHESPGCKGIVHDPETESKYGTIYWTFSSFHGDLVRFDFEKPHGRGSMDHSLANVRRYRDVPLKGRDDVPGHLTVDPVHRQLYIADTGSNRVIVMDMDSGKYVGDARGEFEIYSSMAPTFEYSLYGCTLWNKFADVDSPSGIAVTKSKVFVSEYDTGMIKVFSKTNGEPLGEIDTGLGAGLFGLEIDPKDGLVFFSHKSGKIGYVNPKVACARTELEVDRRYENLYLLREQLNNLPVFDLYNPEAIPMAFAEPYQGYDYYDEQYPFFPEAVTEPYHDSYTYDLDEKPSHSDPHMHHSDKDEEKLDGMQTGKLNYKPVNVIDTLGVLLSQCQADPAPVALPAAIDHEPGYMNMDAISDQYVNADCSKINYDAILLDGFFCHKCLRNPCDNGASCTDHRFVGFTCNCDEITDGDFQYIGDKCQQRVHCSVLSKKSCSELGLEEQAKKVGSPSVCATSRRLPTDEPGTETTARREQGKCLPRTTYENAQETCSAMGMRLCTKKELTQGDAMMPGCGFAYSYILSGTPCANDPEKVVAVPGPVLAQFKRPACVKKTQMLKHMCCADTTASVCQE